MQATNSFHKFFLMGLLVVSITAGCQPSQPSGGNSAKTPDAEGKSMPQFTLSDAQLENLVRRSYQYVAMYNVNNKFAITQGGWNTVEADTELKDHTMTEIARPNNDTLYIACMLDLRKDPVIVEMPAFDSKYVSLMVTAYDHYVNVPMATRLGDFKKPEKMLFYTKRTEGYKGEPVKGVNRLFECSGDFVSAVFRVMPHANEAERFKRVSGQMQSVKAITLSEYRGGKAKPIDDIEFPPVGERDADIYAKNFLEVMQFVCNHTTFDPEDKLDQAFLAALKPLGIEPGLKFDPAEAAKIDDARLRKYVEEMAPRELAKATDPEFVEQNQNGLFQPNGKMTVDRLVFQSVIGPIGLPADEALYPAIDTTDGQPMNAMNDYVLRMSAEELPPAKAFWSVTLYDMEKGLFIPNDRKKYSVGENGGMKLNDKGGIEIHVAAEKPEGVADENWLPIKREDKELSIILRAYVPDQDKMKYWKAPVAEPVAPAK